LIAVAIGAGRAGGIAAAQRGRAGRAAVIAAGFTGWSHGLHLGLVAAQVQFVRGWQPGKPMRKGGQPCGQPPSRTLSLRVGDQNLTAKPP
jgi:hypothetical protein